MKSTPRIEPAAARSEPPDTGATPRAMALALGALFFAGAGVGTLTLLFPHPAYFDDFNLWTNIGIAYLGALALTLTSRRAPVWAIHAFLVTGAIVITRAVVLSEEPGGFYSFWYLWVGLYAFFFFGRGWGIFYTLLVAGLMGWALTGMSGSTPVGNWLMTVTTMAASGVLIEILLRRLRNAARESADQAARLTAVGDVAHEIAQQTVSSATAPAICRATSEVTGASCAALLEPTADGGGLHVVAATDPAKTGQVILLGGPPSGAVQAFASAKPVFVNGDEAEQLEPILAGEAPGASALFQPILREGTPIGVLAVRWDSPIAALSKGAEDTVSLLATEASIAITRAQLLDRLEHAAHTDDLTGTHNRRAWNEELAREVARSGRTGQPLTVAILDLDRFKQYNDSHGHQAGDRMLRRITALWRDRIRPTDVLARYGGDEFALALPDCTSGGADVLIDRLREVLPEGQTISGGYATWDGRENPEELLARADAALYVAKQDGRDRIIG